MTTGNVTPPERVHVVALLQGRTRGTRASRRPSAPASLPSTWSPPASPPTRRCALALWPGATFLSTARSSSTPATAGDSTSTATVQVTHSIYSAYCSSTYSPSNYFHAQPCSSLLAVFGIYVVYITFLIIRVYIIVKWARERRLFVSPFQDTTASLAVINTPNAASFVCHSPGNVYGSYRIPSPRHLGVHGRRDPFSHLTRLITLRSYLICYISNYLISLSISH